MRYENTVFDPPPLDMYTFLFNIGYPGGDGMEHLYSTQMHQRACRGARTQPLLPGLSTAAHEYFHVWNMKRVRAAALGPFDYTREQYQPSLWVGEGWTQYYGQVAHRALRHAAARGDLSDAPPASSARTSRQPGPQRSLGAHGVVRGAVLRRGHARGST